MAYKNRHMEVVVRQPSACKVNLIPAEFTISTIGGLRTLEIRNEHKLNKFAYKVISTSCYFNIPRPIGIIKAGANVEILLKRHSNSPEEEGQIILQLIKTDRSDGAEELFARAKRFDFVRQAQFNALPPASPVSIIPSSPITFSSNGATIDFWIKNCGPRLLAYKLTCSNADDSLYRFASSGYAAAGGLSVVRLERTNGPPGRSFLRFRFNAVNNYNEALEEIFANGKRSLYTLDVGLTAI